MTPECWALGAVVLYGLGVLTGLMIGRRRALASSGQQRLVGPASPLPTATVRMFRRAERKRRLRLGLAARFINNKEVNMAPPARRGRGRHLIRCVGQRSNYTF